MRTSGWELCRTRSEHIKKLKTSSATYLILLLGGTFQVRFSGERRPFSVTNRQEATGGFYLGGNRRGKSEDVQAFGVDRQGSRRAPRRAVNIEGMHRGPRLVACEELS